MNRASFGLLISILLLLTLSACGKGATETPIPPALSNDQLGTRAAQTVYANFTEAAPVEPSDTPVKNTRVPKGTDTPPPPTATKRPTKLPTSDIFGTGQETIRDDFESLDGW